jgi:hypothetical protein
MMIRSRSAGSISAIVSNGRRMNAVSGRQKSAPTSTSGKSYEYEDTTEPRLADLVAHWLASRR